MNKNLLSSVMVIHDDNIKKLAKKLGISPITLSHKMNESNRAEFTQGEICKIKEFYDLSPEQIDSIFFNVKVA